MPGRRFVDAFWLHKLIEAKLNRVVSVGCRRLSLHDETGARLQEGHRDHLPIRPEQLRHADLFSQNSWTHLFSPSVLQLPFTERLDLNVHACREIELHQSIDRLLRRLENIEQ